MHQFGTCLSKEFHSIEVQSKNRIIHHVIYIYKYISYIVIYIMHLNDLTFESRTEAIIQLIRSQSERGSTFNTLSLRPTDCSGY